MKLAITHSRNFYSILVIVALVGVGVFGFSSEAHAFLDWIADKTAAGVMRALAGFAGTIAHVVGGLVINLFYFLLVVANYNQFLSSTAVTVGWIAVRDVVNMFFVLVLIAIAIGTILQRQQYHYSQTLPKFLAAAILVNFSKTICGIAIDAAQVVMMTFAGAISGAGGGNLAALLGITKLLSFSSDYTSGGPAPEAQALIGLVLVLMFLSLALIVVGVMVFILTIRIVALWFLIILSPAFFFLMALPSDRGYASKWLDQFINYLLVGPVMAFFLWLSLTIVAQAPGAMSGDARNVQIGTELGLNFTDSGFWKGELADLGGLEISTIGGLSGYILGIVMLVASLAAAQQLSSVGGNVAGAGLNYFKDYWTGKRGPFNPIRALRETGSGLAQRWEKRRQERVQRRIDMVEGGIGVVAKAGRGVGQAMARRVMETRGGVAAREFYRQRVEAPLDNTFRRIGLGFGRPFRERIEREKTEAAREKNLREQNAGQLRGGAEVVERELHAMEIDRDGLQVQANEARAQGRIADATALEQQVEARNRSIEAGRENVSQLRADADREDRLAQGAELQSVLATLRYGFARFFGQTARAAAFGWAGYGATGAMGLWGTAAVHGADIVNHVGRFGEESVVSANEAQSRGVDEVSKKHAGKSNEELWEMLSGTKSGHNHSATERMGIIKQLLESDAFDANQMDEVRHMFQGQGANGGTMESVEALIRLKHPERAIRPLTVEQRRDLYRTKKIKPEDMTTDRVTDEMVGDLVDPSVDMMDYWLKNVTSDVRDEMMARLRNPAFNVQRQRLYREGKLKPEDLRPEDVNNEVVGDLIDPNVAKLGDFIKKSTVPTRNALRDQLRDRLEAMRTAGTAVDAATGDLTDDFARELRHFAHAGGNMNEFFGLDDQGNGTAAFTADRETEMNGLMRNIGSISAIGGFSNASMRNAASQVRTRLPGMDRASVSKLLKTGSDGFAEQPRAASQIALIADALLEHAQANAWGAGAPSDNIRDVIIQNA